MYVASGRGPVGRICSSPGAHHGAVTSMCGVTSYVLSHWDWAGSGWSAVLSAGVSTVTVLEPLRKLARVSNVTQPSRVAMSALGVGEPAEAAVYPKLSAMQDTPCLPLRAHPVPDACSVLC